jgi:serine phosphatase RsbU (regulator of sigma subunit)
MVVAHKDKIEHQNKQITDSIVYAKRIQEAVLPPDYFINQFLKVYFILFKPRDIVSGDFYWTYMKDSVVFLAAVDCTGHGVPGAFMSMLGYSFLNEIINQKEVETVTASEVLNELREKIKKSLRQTGKENEAKDGMDMAFCVIDFKNSKMQFAGAQNPLIIVRDNEIIQIKADRMPIGIYLRERESFTNNEIQMQKGDTYYLFSDGYEDQFGGPQEKKFMIKNFKELLLNISLQPMSEQKQILDETLEHWMRHPRKNDAHFDQVDDILVIGLRYV